MLAVICRGPITAEHHGRHTEQGDPRYGGHQHCSLQQHRPELQSTAAMCLQSAALLILADGNMDSEYLANLHFIALMPSSCQNAEYAVWSVYYINAGVLHSNPLQTLQ